MPPAHATTCIRSYLIHVGCWVSCTAGDSAERPSGAATDAETGPSPAAACGVVPPVGHVHHRVVRRLDQHEAWGATRASPSKPPLAGDSSVKREALAGSGTGFSLFSPVKKQRVPLFNETSSIKVGATPSKSDAQGRQGRAVHMRAGCQRLSA